MKGIGEKMKNRVLIYGLLLSATIATESSSSGNLRRQRKRQLGEHHGIRQQNSQSTNVKLEDIWNKAAAAANTELEYERMLFMSMPTRAPTRPSPNPTTPAPTTRANTGQPTPRPTIAPNPVPTASPVNCLQGKTKREYISDLVESITSGDLLNDPSTPQGKALDFLVNDDQLLEDPCTVSTARIQQRYGLSVFYFSMEGENWVDPSGWLSGDDECTWFGVECHEDDDDTVKYLRLSTSFSPIW